jgi:hypothetical protein
VGGVMFLALLGFLFPFFRRWIVLAYLKSVFVICRISTILPKRLIRSVMTYACRVWEFAGPAKKKFLRTIGNFPRRTPVRELHVTFKIPYIYDFITKLCRQQAGHTKSH